MVRLQTEVMTRRDRTSRGPNIADGHVAFASLPRHCPASRATTKTGYYRAVPVVNCRLLELGLYTGYIQRMAGNLLGSERQIRILMGRHILDHQSSDN